MRLTREQIKAWRKHWNNASALDEDSVGAHSDELAELNTLCDLALLGLAQEQNNAAPSIQVGTATTDLSQPRTWNGENVQVHVPAAPDAAPPALQMAARLRRCADNPNLVHTHLSLVPVLLLREAATALESQPQWVSVKERLPDDGQRVLLVTHGEVRTGTYLIPSIQKMQSGFDWPGVTHWMPLPAAPQDSGEG